MVRPIGVKFCTMVELCHAYLHVLVPLHLQAFITTPMDGCFRVEIEWSRDGESVIRKQVTDELATRCAVVEAGSAVLRRDVESLGQQTSNDAASSTERRYDGVWCCYDQRSSSQHPN